MSDTISLDEDDENNEFDDHLVFYCKTCENS